MTVEQSRVTAYLAELRSELRGKAVAEIDAEQVLAEVRSHLAETGEDPVEAFGPPGVYATAYAAPAASSITPSGARGGIPVWGKVIIGLLALMCAPVLLMMLLAPAVAVLGASGGVAGVEVVAILGAYLGAAAVVWWAVRGYRRRPGTSTFGAWLVGLGVLLLIGLLVGMVVTVATMRAGS